MTDRETLTSQSKSRVEITLRLSVLLVWFAAILWLSLTSSPPEIPGALGWDKLLHTGAYALLALLLAQFLHFIFQKSGTTFWVTALSATACGGLIEVLQWAGQAGRTAEWWDLAADAIGVIAGCVIFRHGRRVPFLYHDQRDKHHG